MAYDKKSFLTGLAVGQRLKGAGAYGVEVGDVAKTVSINYVEFASGKFYETIDTGETITYNVTFDENSKPITITNDSGNTVTVEW